MRTLLVLARVSNLPTVWSNCLAAWLLAGGGPWSRFSLVCLGASFLYTGGMFLNDAVDVDFDRRYRSERPIVSGQIGLRFVWLLAVSWLAIGWIVFLFVGKSAALVAAVLVATIVAYDLVHKRTRLAPLLMAACRFLLYLLAASAVAPVQNSLLVWRALALGLYIVGLSYLARGESTGVKPLPWPPLLLLAPAVVAMAFPVWRNWTQTWVLIVQIAWTAWCLIASKPTALAPVPKGVAGLLAGISLVDLLAAAGHGYPPVFLGLFVLALLLQRIAPAT